jgi:putative membrane protein
MYMWQSGWGWFWMSVAMVAFWALVAWVVVTIARQAGGAGQRNSDARALLDERLARGEMEEEEYRRRRDLIQR